MPAMVALLVVEDAPDGLSVRADHVDGDQDSLIRRYSPGKRMDERDLWGRGSKMLRKDHSNSVANVPTANVYGDIFYRLFSRNTYRQ